MGCDGRCCVVFTVNASMDVMRAGPWFRINTQWKDDGDLIGFMLREITREEANERGERFGVHVPSAGPLYKCVYWDEETRLCGAYNDRPNMCRDYPYPLNELREPDRSAAGKCDHGCDCKGSPLVWLGD